MSVSGGPGMSVSGGPGMSVSGGPGMSVSGGPGMSTGLPLTGRAHLAAVREALACLDVETERLDRWGAHAAAVLVAGGRLLAAGNGGSAAEAQHLTAELVGRYRDDRPPLSALALHAETSSLTAISNDYGHAEAFARQVRAHGRRDDMLVLLSTSGRSPNVLAAAEAGHDLGLRVWGLTGPAPNPLAERCDDAICVDATEVPTIQEVHLVTVHLLCAAIDVAVRAYLLEGARV
jgi:D-sedoheptulose 7-phosphate isomerase